MKSGQIGNTKVWMLVAALAVAIAAVVFFGSNYPPDSEMASGTIVPAERYRSEQLSSDDVVLGDETIAQVMQTELYQMIISDADFASMLQSDQFRDLLANDQFRGLLANDQFRDLLASDQFRDLLASDQFRE